ncbi:MAG TPA: ABC transporter permease [Caldimonas sp.]|jgi:NitT/TauT family transport system permease protein/taurine transport system permease protein|nr:ABC transporter permease [Caldimonas sp.]HEX2539554.1 ABC transporter permease [Caldimonas sp.]
MDNPDRMGKPGRLASAAWFVLPLVALLVVWEVVVRGFDVSPRTFPALDSVLVAGAAAVADGSLIRHIGASLGRVALGTLIGIALAVPLGIAMGTNRAVSAFFTPLLRFFSVLAGIAWIPIATLWFGYGFGAITFVIFNAVFFVVAYNTLLGVTGLALPLRHAAASLGATRWQMLTEVLLPGALPNIVTGIRTGLGFAWRGLIAAEMIATNVGLGYMLFVARDFYRTEVIVMGMIVIGVLWLLIDRLLLAPWERATIERWGMVRAA